MYYNPNSTQDLRNNLLEDAIAKIVDAKLAHKQVWVPALVDSYDRERGTVKVKEIFPTRGFENSSDYENESFDVNESYYAEYEIPLLTYSTNLFEFNLPIQQNDTVLVLFTNKDVHAWFMNGAAKYFMNLPTVDLPNNAIAIPCLFNLAQIKARQSGENVNQNNVVMNYMRSKIDMSKEDIKFSSTRKIAIEAERFMVKANNVVFDDKVRITTANGNVNILMNIMNQLYLIIDILQNQLPTCPVAGATLVTTSMAPDLAILRRLIKDLESSVQ
jgi:hypothetical protein